MDSSATISATEDNHFRQETEQTTKNLQDLFLVRNQLTSSPISSVKEIWKKDTLQKSGLYHSKGSVGKSYMTYLTPPQLG